MRETAEFRVNEKFAPMLFRDNEGKRLGTGAFVRKIRIRVDDERFQKIGQLNSQLRSLHDEPFFYSWDICRDYTNKELDQATWFFIKLLTYFEPAGEECGTLYDESSACPKCGAGAAQVSHLVLDLRKAPKAKDIASTIAGEWIVSQRLAETLLLSGLTGFELRPVRHRARYEDDPVDLHKVPTGREILLKAETAGVPHPTWGFSVWLNRAENNALWEQAHAEHAALKREKAQRSPRTFPAWYQVVILSSDADLTTATRTGIDPFDNDEKNEYRCANGDLVGLNLLSEVSALVSTQDRPDIFNSRQFIGARRGLLRPSPVTFISREFRKLLIQENVRGYRVEVAHIA